MNIPSTSRSVGLVARIRPRLANTPYAPSYAYHPPESQADARMRSRVQANTFAHLEHTIRKILPGGRKMGNIYRKDSYLVALAAGYVPELDRHLEAGEWGYLSWGRWYIGRDPIALHAHFNYLEYSKSVEVLHDHFGFGNLAEAAEQCEGVPGFVQEIKPLWVPREPLDLVPDIAIDLTYRNAVGAPIIIVARWRGFNGEEITSYWSLWRSRSQTASQWLDIFPEYQPPFHLDKMVANPQSGVVFFGDEFSADRFAWENPELLASAIPGGYENVHKADLRILKNRSAQVVLCPDNLPHVHRIHAKLQAVGVTDAKYSLKIDEQPKSFDEMVAIADQLGATLLESISETSVSTSDVVALTAAELGTLDLPPRDFLLAPIIPERGLVMVHAPRGIGKTRLALECAVAIATGGTVLSYQAPKAKGVLYLDGEMSATEMQKRLRSIAGETLPETLRIITPDLQGGAIPDLSTVEGQTSIEPHLKGMSLVVIDNLSCLCRSGNENEGGSWGATQSWILDLRRRGIAVLIVHHSGKSGGQRGTSRREDVLDVVIGLRRPENYNPSQGARFEVHIEKGRHLYGEDAAAFEARMEVVDGRAVWHVTDLTPAPVSDRDEQIYQLSHQGLSVRKIAGEAGVSKSTVERVLQKRVASETLCNDLPD